MVSFLYRLVKEALINTPQQLIGASFGSGRAPVPSYSATYSKRMPRATLCA
jgi:hypothetical protein